MQTKTWRGVWSGAGQVEGDPQGRTREGFKTLEVQIVALLKIDNCPEVLKGENFQFI
jgi:hypothetical protein